LKPCPEAVIVSKVMSRKSGTAFLEKALKDGAKLPTKGIIAPLHVFFQSFGEAGPARDGLSLF